MSTPGHIRLLSSSGPGAIALLEISGRGAVAFAARHLRFSHPNLARTWPVGRVLRAALLDESGVICDDILVSIHAGPPELVLRMHLHGSPFVVSQTIGCATALGFERASESEPAGAARCDASDRALLKLLPTILTQAGVEWLLRQGDVSGIAAKLLGGDSAAAGALTDSAERSVRILSWLQRPLRVALVGPPNAGKSTLMNALADRRVSLVSPVPGTTRDWVEAAGELHGFPVTWIDTAGLRETDDVLEQAGIDRTAAIAREADLTVAVLDLTCDGIAAAGGFARAYADLRPALIVACKADLSQADASPELPWNCPRVSVSALTGAGMTTLLDAVSASSGRDASILSA